MKLSQAQIWKKDGQYLRIVRLERLEVEYKTHTSLVGKDGVKTVTSKKDFCRLLKGATLLPPPKKISPPKPTVTSTSASA
ncbi:MAG: hypothetical protein RL380_924 [Verrucomicrobiota bacterium]|jgi:hypothetical protein